MIEQWSKAATEVELANQRETVMVNGRATLEGWVGADAPFP